MKIKEKGMKEVIETQKATIVKLIQKNEDAKKEMEKEMRDKLNKEEELMRIIDTKDKKISVS